MASIRRAACPRRFWPPKQRRGRRRCRRRCCRRWWCCLPFLHGAPPSFARGRDAACRALETLEDPIPRAAASLSRRRRDAGEGGRRVFFWENGLRSFLWKKKLRVRLDIAVGFSTKKIFFSLSLFFSHVFFFFFARGLPATGKREINSNEKKINLSLDHRVLLLPPPHLPLLPLLQPPRAPLPSQRSPRTAP